VTAQPDPQGRPQDAQGVPDVPGVQDPQGAQDVPGGQDPQDAPGVQEPATPAGATPGRTEAVPPAADEVPDAETLERTATPASLRRAPRYKSFVWTGLLVGLVAATVLVLAVPRQGDSGVGTGTVWALLALGLGMAGALLGALVALLADRSSRR
jgi:hypothetical protein